MTRKDYILLSNLLKRFNMTKDSITIELFKNLCNELKKDNPRFDEIKFKIACHYPL